MFDQRMLPDLTLTSGLYVYHCDLRVSRTKNTVTFSLIITQQDVDYTVTRDINLPYQFYFVYFSQLTKYHIENQFDLLLPRYNVSL